MPQENKNQKTKITIIEQQKNDQENAVIIEPQKLAVKKSGNIIIGTLNVFITPVKKRWQNYYQPKNKKWGIHLIIDLILALAIIGLIAFNWYWWRMSEFSLTRQVTLEITTMPAEPISGQDLTYLINYRNRSKKQLNDAKITVQWPPEFIKKFVEPAEIFTAHSQTFNLGELASGAGGQLKIKGFIFGAKDDQQIIAANLSFLLVGSKKYQQKYIDQLYQIKDSKINLIIEAPTKVSNGNQFDWSIKYENNSDYLLPKIIVNLAVEADYFNLLTSDPAVNKNQWAIKPLAPRSSGQINLTSAIKLPSDRNEFPINVQLLIEDGDRLIPQQNLKRILNIEHSKLKLNLTSDQNIIQTGEEVNYQLKYENQEDFPIKNVRINIRLIGDFYESTGSLSWDQNQFIELAKINPGQNGQINFSVKTKEPFFLIHSQQKNPILISQAEAYYFRENEPAVEILALSSRLQQKINTVLNLKSFARYYTAEGDQLGIGPLPPKVDSTTKYWIFFNLENLYNDVSNLQITAQLAKNVFWTNKTSTNAKQDIIYDQEKNLISWSLEKLESPSNLLPSIGAAFEIEFTPTEDQAEKIANLLTTIKISALDNFTLLAIEKDLPDITTNLIMDTHENSGGIIQKNNHP